MSSPKPQNVGIKCKQKELAFTSLGFSRSPKLSDRLHSGLSEAGLETLRSGDDEPFIRRYPSRRSGLLLAFDERLEHSFQCDFSLSRASFAIFEFDPAFVETIKHLNAGCGILHALGFE